MMAAGFPAKESKASGFPANELQAAGFSASNQAMNITQGGPVLTDKLSNATIGNRGHIALAD